MYFVIRRNCSVYVKTQAGLALTNWVHMLDVVHLVVHIAKLTVGCSGSSGDEEKGSSDFPA